MPSLTTSPATPRNEAAERYSPDTAAAFRVGEIRRDATRKSGVLRIAATPRAPINRVASTTSAMATAVKVRPRIVQPARPGAAASERAAPAPGTATPPRPARTPPPQRSGPRPAKEAPQAARVGR